MILLGDTIHSYAYDGDRIKKWNVSSCTYGEEWQLGDVIGCALDLDNGNVNFYTIPQVMLIGKLDCFR